VEDFRVAEIHQAGAFQAVRTRGRADFAMHTSSYGLVVGCLILPAGRAVLVRVFKPISQAL